MIVFKVSLVICNDIKREKEIKKETKKKKKKERKKEQKRICFKHYIYIMTKHNIHIQSRAYYVAFIGRCIL
jgi:hypothetical protein